MKQFDPETKHAAYRIAQVAWHIHRLLRVEVEQRQPTGLTFTQLRALGALHATPGASLSELAEDLGLQKPTASKTVDELVRQGLVVREVVPDNRRKQALYATGSGTEALEAAAGVAFTAIDDLLARLTHEEREAVDRAMALLHPLVRGDSAPAGATNAPSNGGQTHAA